VSAETVAVRSSEFDATDKGIGVRFTWLPSRLVGADAEVNFFPNDFHQSSFNPWMNWP